MATNLHGLRDVPRRTFRTRTPPDVHQDAIILAAASPDIESGSPSREGWILSDLYAFNYMLKGLGSEQVWLTTASPTDVIARHGDCVHGNKVDDNQKIVLSKPLLENDQLSPVTVVDPEEMIESYLYHVEKMSAKAARQDQPLLLMLFGIGFSETGFLMNTRDRDTRLDFERLETRLDFERLENAIADGCRATLVSPNCFSGGWDITDLSKGDPARMDTPILVTPHDEIISHAARMCGSIFAGPIIKTLSSSSSPLLDIPTDGDTEPESLQPKEPTEEQEAAYNAFCASVVDACTGDETWDRHGFFFRAEDDHWSKSWTRSGKTLEYFENRWNALETPKNDDTGSDDRDSQANDERISAMATLFMESCPGDWSGGYNINVRTLLRETVKNPGNPEPLPYREEIDPVSLIRYRWELGHLADLLVRHYNLPVPNDEIFISWRRMGQQTQNTREIHHFSEHSGRAYGIFSYRGLGPGPARAQGYHFNRYFLYTSKAVALTGGSEAEIVKLAEDMVLFVKKLQQFVTGPVLENQDVIDKRKR
ncbi:hypothetical protein CkaCkLH20_02999 [Colletotrichum karsti]|uniref:Uncharacterized protein n=1 Tax=Colletotrichum karsti TaxID=1095194 RepID=A0A9P6IF89_9PEZI|nr:uncharacterized protein CkaCkLH20_02999 [Colletotrichum karsti]KAF9879456.1 hypothetical protein CkaCkLH20_02999 [Colletotrichum karsti]